LPAGFILRQYHSYHLSDVNALLEHWTTRQAEGKAPFRFTKAVVKPRQPEPVSGERGPSNSMDDVGKAQELGGDSQQEDDEGPDLNNAQEASGDPGPSRVSAFPTVIAYDIIPLFTTAFTASQSPLFRSLGK
jgi:hypothetical protein